MINVYILNKSNNRNLSNYILNYAYKDIYNKDIDLSKITKNSYGKPYYDDKFYYSISHSKNYIVIATNNKEIGIDIEEDRKYQELLKDKILYPKEEIIDNNIIINWVIKEAYSKYKGIGYGIDFKTINTNLLLNDHNLKNISTSSYYCYIYTEGKINKIEIIKATTI